MSMRNSIFKTHRHDIWSKFIKAIKDYDLIQENDTIAICISGGKDSMLLAYLFKLYQPISEIKFDVKYFQFKFMTLKFSVSLKTEKIPVIDVPACEEVHSIASQKT